MSDLNLLKVIDSSFLLIREFPTQSTSIHSRKVFQVSSNGAEYILKFIESESEKERKHAERERQALLKCSGILGITQLVHDYGILKVNNLRYSVILKEFFEGDDLRFAKYDRFLVYNHLKETLSSIHDREVVPLDMWPQNVVVSETGEPKFIDLGQCLFVGKNERRYERITRRDMNNLRLLFQLS